MREIIVEELERRDMKPAHFARLMHKRCGVSQSHIFNYLAGRRDMSAAMFETACEVLQVDVYGVPFGGTPPIQGE